MKAQLVNKMKRSEMVEFDFNPDSLTMQRDVEQHHGPGGATQSIFRSSAPRTLSGKANLEGSDVKSRGEQLVNWCEPVGGVAAGQAAAGHDALSGGRANLAKDPPTLLFLWGPFVIECRIVSLTVTFQRFDFSGNPTRAEASFQIREQPSMLGLTPTNPTSGGRPGRRRHVVSHGESLALIAAQTYGYPGAWRGIAEVNGIDDPFRVGPGRVVYLPNADELASTRR